MSGVFLSYRRQDSDYATLLYAWLAERFGSARLFWDREDIDPGEDFRQVLTTRLREADALVALIGPGWSPSEWIQREIGLSLRRKSLVLPVIVGDAPHLEAEALPRSIRKIASLQTLETRDLRFRQRFMQALDSIESAAASRGGHNDPTTDDYRVRRLTDLLRRQVDRSQEHALQLVLDGNIDEALPVLNETFEVLMLLLDIAPGDPTLEIRLGFLYKEFAQAFRSEPAQFHRYLQSGLQLFEGLVERKLKRDDEASAWNGLGNMYLLQNNFDRAVECCQHAVRIAPDYGNAWADLFLGLDGQAKNARVNLPAMRRALGRLEAIARGDSLLSGVVPGYRNILRRWERQVKPRVSQKTRK